MKLNDMCRECQREIVIAPDEYCKDCQKEPVWVDNKCRSCKRCRAGVTGLCFFCGIEEQRALAQKRWTPTWCLGRSASY